MNELLDKIATALNLDYIVGDNWVEWHKASGKEVKKLFKSKRELRNYLEGVMLAIELS